MQTHYLDAEQVAQELGVGIRKAREIIKQCGGRKVTKGYVVTRAALDAWIVAPAENGHRRRATDVIE